MARRPGCAGGDGAASAILHLRAAALVRKLRADNYGAFAEIFCLAVMQVGARPPSPSSARPLALPCAVP